MASYVVTKNDHNSKPKVFQHDLSAKNEIAGTKDNHAGGQIAKKIIIGKSK